MTDSHSLTGKHYECSKDTYLYIFNKKKIN